MISLLYAEITFWKNPGGDEGPKVDEGSPPRDDIFEPEYEIRAYKLLSDPFSGAPVGEEHAEIHDAQTHV